MKPRFTIAIALLIVCAVAGTGTALAMSADSSDLGPIDLHPLKPSPSPLPLVKPIHRLVTDTGSGSGGSGSGSGTTTTGSTDGSSKQGTKTGSKGAPSGADAASIATGGFTWSIPYGGWKRLFAGASDQWDSQVSYLTTTRAVPVTAPARASITNASRTIPENPAYLWLLLPVGMLCLWVAAYAVFEPNPHRGGVLVFASSVRRTSRELPAGLTRTAARGVVRLARGVGKWGRR